MSFFKNDGEAAKWEKYVSERVPQKRVNGTTLVSVEGFVFDLKDVLVEDLQDVCAKWAVAISEMDHDLKMWDEEIALATLRSRLLFGRPQDKIALKAVYDYQPHTCTDCGAVGTDPCVPGCPNLDGLPERIWGWGPNEVV